MQQPTVDQRFRRRFVEYLVVNIEHGHHPQIEHRQPHVDAEQSVQDVGGLSDQPVFDPEYLHHVGHRVTLEPRRVEIFVVHDQLRRLLVTTFAHRHGQAKRVVAVVDVFLVQFSQLLVDPPEFGVDLEALRDELRFDGTHAQILDVHKQIVHEQRNVYVGLVIVYVVQPSQVDGQDQQQARKDHDEREYVERSEFGGRRRRVHLERVDGRFVPRHVFLALVHDGDPGKEYRRRQHSVVDPQHGRRKNYAPVVHFAQGLRRGEKSVHTRGHQQYRVRVLKSIVTQVDRKHAAQSPEHPN